MEGGDNKYTKFTVSILTAFLKARSQNVSGNKHLLLMLYNVPQNAFFPMHSRSSGLLKNDAKMLLSILHHLSPVIFANAAVVAFVLLHNSRFHFHCYTQREPMPAQKLARKWQLRPFATSCTKDYEGHSFIQTSFAEPPNSINKQGS